MAKNLESSDNYFVPCSKFLTEAARQRVIDKNGELVTPVKASLPEQPSRNSKDKQDKK